MVLTMNYLCLFNSLESLLHYNVHYKTVFDMLQKLQLPSTNFYHCISIYSSQYMQISIRLKNHKRKKRGHAPFNLHWLTTFIYGVHFCVLNDRINNSSVVQLRGYHLYRLATCIYVLYFCVLHVRMINFQRLLLWNISPQTDTTEQCPLITTK